MKQDFNLLLTQTVVVLPEVSHKREYPWIRFHPPESFRSSGLGDERGRVRSGKPVGSLPAVDGGTGERKGFFGGPSSITVKVVYDPEAFRNNLVLGNDL